MKKIWSVIKKYVAHCDRCLVDRWKKFPVNIYEAEVSEVVMGILGRQITLSQQLAIAPQIWNSHSAPLFLRSMGDSHINLAWICKDPLRRSREFIIYGIGQEILSVENYKSIAKEEEIDDLDEVIRLKELWIDRQRLRQLTEINLGSWSGQSIRKMAEEAGELNFYKFSYAPFSAAVHSSWQHISVFNLTQCNNPLHKFHQVPGRLELRPEPDFLYRSAKYVTKSIDIIDKTFSINSRMKSPLDYVDSLLAKAFPS